MSVSSSFGQSFESDDKTKKKKVLNLKPFSSNLPADPWGIRKSAPQTRFLIKKC